MTASFALKNNNFLLCKERNSDFINDYDIGGFKFQYHDRDAVFTSDDKKSVILFGTIVDSENYNTSSDDIAHGLLNSKDFSDLIGKSKKLAGRYVIVYCSDEGLFVLPDATASIQVAYSISSNDLYVSSNPKIIADMNKWQESPLSIKIKNSAHETHPLPYDMSMYDQVKFVIPNHYLDCNAQKMIRYYPLVKTEEITVDAAASISCKSVNNIILGYMKKYRLSLPLTSGLDSRAILSFCKDKVSEIPVFTFFHDNFHEETGDIVVPRKISSAFGLDYYKLDDLELPNELIATYQTNLGSNTNLSEARNAWTYYNSELSQHLRLDGGVIPLAKSNFGGDLPEFLAKPSYFVTKTHNYSKENYKEVIRWCKDIRPYVKSSKISAYDLFFWEHRFGKWSPNSYLNSDLLAETLNPFNCRELIETWLQVPRKNRMNKEIHKEIIRLNWNELLEFPFNPGGRFDIVYKHSLLFYIASKLKFTLERRAFNDSIQ